MTNLLFGKKILVAGAGGLLGAHVVKNIIEEGGEAIACDYDIKRTENKLKDINISTGYKLYQLDITNIDSVQQALSITSELDGAVNATYPRNKAYGAHFFDVTVESFNENLALHLGSAFLFSQQCAALFNKTKHPFSLVNISSVYGVIAPKFEIYENTQMTMPVEYAAIKSALLHLNKYIVSYVNDSRFKINAVSPGGIFDYQPEDFLEAYKKNTLGAGMLDVKAILGAIIFLLSDNSKYMNCQNLVVDDGFIL